MALVRMAREMVDEGVGRHHRDDPVLPATGGPAGNAQLTAWTGLVLLVLLAAELLTVVDLGGLLTWHVGIGLTVIPLVLLKTATTGWRMVRYYRGNEAYRHAGPPPTVLRMLGPLVIVLTLALLGSGVALILLGPETSRNTLVTVLGQRVNARTVHVVLAVAWTAVTAVHVLGRLLPAGRLAAVHGTPAVPGSSARVVALLASVLIAAVIVTLVLPLGPAWTQDRRGQHDGQPPSGSPHTYQNHDQDDRRA